MTDLEAHIESVMGKLVAVTGAPSVPVMAWICERRSAISTEWVFLRNPIFEFDTATCHASRITLAPPEAVARVVARKLMSA